jgi:transcriptional regulator with XRE-family HTH domain
VTTLRNYRIDLGWSINKLAQEAGLPHQNVKRAEDGEPIQASTAKAIADTLSRALGYEVKPSEIEGLNIM